MIETLNQYFIDVVYEKILNNIGLMLHPCFSPTFEGRKSVIPQLGKCTLNLVFSDIFFNKETNFPV